MVSQRGIKTQGLLPIYTTRWFCRGKKMGLVPTTWGPLATSPGNDELLNLGQLSRICLESHWPTEKGRVLLSGLPCLKSWPCSMSNVHPIPLLSSCLFSHPSAEARLERLALPETRAKCGAGVLRSRDITGKCCPVLRNSPQHQEAQLLNSPLSKSRYKRPPLQISPGQGLLCELLEKQCSLSGGTTRL